MKYSAFHPVRTAIDILCLTCLLVNTSNGLYLLNPGIELAVASKSTTQITFYGGPLTSVVLALMCYSISARTVRTNWAPVATFIAVACLSILTSVDAFTTSTALVRSILFVMAINAYIGARGAASFFAVTAVLLAIVNLYSAFTAVFEPAIGLHSFNINYEPDLQGRTQIAKNYEDPALVGDWRGIFLHKNSLAQAALAGALLLITIRRSLPWPSGISLALSGVCLLNLYMTHSATSGIAFLSCLAAYFLLLRRRASAPRLVVGVIIPLALGLLAATTIANLVDLGRGEFSFSNRVPIWSYVIEILNESPLLGFGYGAGSNYVSERLTKDLFRAAVDAHNGYLQIAVECGYLGLLAFIVALIISFWRGLVSWRTAPVEVDHTNRVALLILIGAMVSAFAEITPTVLFSGTGFLTFGAMLAISRAPRGGVKVRPDRPTVGRSR